MEGDGATGCAALTDLALLLGDNIAADSDTSDVNERDGWDNGPSFADEDFSKDAAVAVSASFCDFSVCVFISFSRPTQEGDDDNA